VDVPAEPPLEDPVENVALGLLEHEAASAPMGITATSSERRVSIGFPFVG
jgi:hypothetical protein